MHRAPGAEAAVSSPIAVLLKSDDPALRAAWARRLPDGVVEAVDEQATVTLLDGPEHVRELGCARLVVVGPPDPVAVRTVLSAGARGYLFRRPEPGAAADRGLDAGARGVGSVIEMSAREVEVLQGVADGRSNGDIAAALRLSPAHRQEPPRPHRAQARHRRPCARCPARPPGWCDHLSGHIDGPASVIEVTEPGREL